MTSKIGFRGERIGVLAVTYNQCDLTVRFVEMFLRAFANAGVYLLVLDNNSSDGTVEISRKQFPDVDIRRLNDNYGCVTGRNIGVIELYKLGCDIIYITDNDIVIENRDFFHYMELFLSTHPDIVGCCPVVRWADDRNIQTLGSRRVSRIRTKNISMVDSNQSVSSLPGCAQFIRTEAFKKYGLYDNDLSPLSLEDYEWGMRATKMGAKLCYNPEAEVLHLHDRTKRDSAEKIGHLITGRMVYLRKHFSPTRMLQELRFLIPTAREYGIAFTLRHYLNGAAKRIHRQNYDFEVFMQQGVKRYYA